MSNFKNFNVIKTIDFFNNHTSVEIEELFHILKREQFFALNSPSSFKDKLPFLVELNKELIKCDIPYQMKLYFEYMEQLYKMMHLHYLNFETFYHILERQDKTEFFPLYLFGFYSQIWFELNKYVEAYRKDIHNFTVLDSRKVVKVPNTGGQISNIDSQMEYFAEFIQQNMAFYRYKKSIKKDKKVIIKPNISDIQINVELKKLLNHQNEAINKATVESFNSWVNGKILMDNINLFDWCIEKEINGKNITYSVIPKDDKLNEFINNEFGNYLYGHLKFYATSMEHLPQIIEAIKLKNTKQVIELTYLYIQEDLEKNYYINSNIFNEKYNGYSLKSYTYFYLIYKTYLSHFEEEKLNLYKIDEILISKHLLKHINLFENEFKINNKKIISEFIIEALDFFTNNGSEDMFNYPFYKFEDFSLSYLIPNTIIHVNMPRMFLERFSKIVSNKILSQKGLVLEKFLLSNINLLSFYGIKVLKNIPLKKGRKTLGEIDILLFDGKEIIIVELKNQTIPNNLQELYKRKKDLKKATEQIKRAKDYLLNNIDSMSKKLDIDLNNITNITPIVATTVDKIHNITINDTLVVNTLSLKIYFEKANMALRELGSNDVVKREYYKTIVSIADYLDFVKTNRFMDTMSFFEYKEIKNIEIFKNEHISFRIQRLSEK